MATQIFAYKKTAPWGTAFFYVEKLFGYISAHLVLIRSNSRFIRVLNSRPIRVYLFLLFCLRSL